MNTEADVIAALQRHPDVVDAVVFDIDLNGKATKIAAVGVQEYCSPPLLREYVCQSFDGEAVIDGVLAFDDLPRINGKADLTHIREFALKHLDRLVFEPPCDDLERGLADIWAQALNVSRVGATDDFLDLGGGSLQAVRIIAAIHDEWDITVDLFELMDSSSVRGLADVIRRKGQAA